jgi:hypothetical protein
MKKLNKTAARKGHDPFCLNLAIATSPRSHIGFSAATTVTNLAPVRRKVKEVLYEDNR